MRLGSYLFWTWTYFTSVNDTVSSELTSKLVQMSLFDTFRKTPYFRLGKATLNE